MKIETEQLRTNFTDSWTRLNQIESFSGVTRKNSCSLRNVKITSDIQRLVNNEIIPLHLRNSDYSPLSSVYFRIRNKLIQIGKLFVESSLLTDVYISYIQL